MSEMYYAPEKHGLEPFGEIDWSSGSYEFDLTVVWRRTADGTFMYGEDAGCSCPSPFEDKGPGDLEPIRSLSTFHDYLEDRQRTASDGSRQQEIAGLLERLHAAGVR